MHKFWLTVFCLWAVYCGHAQGVKWYVEAPKKVYADGPFEISFVLENGTGKDIRFPDFGELEVLAGPSVSNQYSNYNGVESSTVAYTFKLLADKVGMATIGEASIVSGSRIYKTKATTIAILPSKDSGLKKGGDAAVVKLQLSDKTIYKGQQLTAEYQLYYRGSIGFEDAIQHPPFQGFNATSLKPDNVHLPGISIGGYTYEGILADAIALYPQKTGVFQIGRSYFPLKERLPNDDPWANPFGQYRSFQVATQETKVEVLPLPQPLPKSFHGVVGKYDGKAELSEKRVSKNKTINIRIQISGNGDPAVMSPPLLKLPPQLEAYPAKLLSEEKRIQDQQLWHHHVWQIPVTASDTGRFEIGVVFNYFDTESQSFATLDVEPLRVLVLPANQMGPSITERNPVQGRSHKYLIGGLAIIGISLAGGWLLYQKSQQNHKPEERTFDVPISAPITSPPPQPMTQSDRFIYAKQMLDQERWIPFHESLAIVVRNAIQEKWHIETEELTLSRITKVLDQLDGQNDLSHRYKEISGELEAALYAGKKTDDPIALLEKCREFVHRVEELPKL